VLAVYPLCSRGTRGEHIKSPEQRRRAGEALEFRTFSRSTLPTSVSAWVTPGDTVLPGFRAVIQAFSVAWAEQCMGDTCPTCFVFHLSESGQTEIAAGRMTGSGTVGNRRRARALVLRVPAASPSVPASRSHLLRNLPLQPPRLAGPWRQVAVTRGIQCTVTVIREAIAPRQSRSQAEGYSGVYAPVTVIPLFEERPLPAIATLGSMVWSAGKDGARKSRQGTRRGIAEFGVQQTVPAMAVREPRPRHPRR
jgi:hypothetical protein